MSDENSKKRLGRGLAALMGDLDQPIKKTEEVPAQSSEAAEPLKNETFVEADILRQGERIVPIEHIRANPNNPRKFFADSDLADLSNSIKEHGIVQPILVRPVRGEDLGGAQFEIIAGERRWRAAQRAALHEVPIIVREVADKQALELAIIENVQRADLNSIEEALGYQQLIDEYDYSQNDLAQVIGKSRSHVANTLRLLKLPKEVQNLVSSGSLSAGHARTLVTADNPSEIARLIVEKGLSVRQAEEMAQGDLETKSAGSKSTPSGKHEKSADIRALEQRLEDSLGLKIDLRHGDKEKGELRIKYSSLDQLDEVCKRLQNGLLGS